MSGHPIFGRCPFSSNGNFLLDRFEAVKQDDGTYTTKKICSFVDIPEEIDLSQFCQTETPDLKKFKLYSYVNHEGTIGAGHYYAMCECMERYDFRCL